MRLGKPLIATRAPTQATPAIPPVVYEPVLLIHGTYANTEQPEAETDSWWARGSAFCRGLDNALARNGSQARTWAALPAEFAWSGQNLESARRQAGKALARQIRDLDRQVARYHIIAHSHGGNVLLHALLERRPERLGAVIFLGTPCFTFRDSKSRWTPTRVGLAVYWLGLIGSLWAGWRVDYRWMALALTNAICLIAAIPKEVPAEGDEQWWKLQIALSGGPFDFATGRINPILYYGTGTPYAYVFEADEAVHGLKRIADLAEQPRKIFGTFFSGASESRPPIKPVTIDRSRSWFDELNEMPHSRLLRGLERFENAAPPGTFGTPPPINPLQDFVKSALGLSPLPAFAGLCLGIVWLFELLPFLMFFAARSIWVALERLVQSALTWLVHAVGPRSTAWYLRRKFYGLDIGVFELYRTMPPAVNKLEPVSLALETKMHGLSMSMGANLWAEAMKGTETLALRAQLEKLFGDPTLAHTRYLREAEIINSVAANILKHSRPTVLSAGA